MKVIEQNVIIHNLLQSIIDTTKSDAIELVMCDNCVIHGDCKMEKRFREAGFSNPCCCAGREKT